MKPKLWTLEFSCYCDECGKTLQANQTVWEWDGMAYCTMKCVNRAIERETFETSDIV